VRKALQASVMAAVWAKVPVIEPSGGYLVLATQQAGNHTVFCISDCFVEPTFFSDLMCGGAYDVKQ
jgi:hypothetical protein